jgi:hypothetical protein
MTTTSQILEELAGLVGWDHVATLVRMAGGQERKIPGHASDEHWLTTFIGRVAADALCKRYGGTALWIPKNDGGVRQLRDARIKALRTEGATVNALATEFRLTDRQIYNILSEAAEEG